MRGMQAMRGLALPAVWSWRYPQRTARITAKETAITPAAADAMQPSSFVLLSAHVALTNRRKASQFSHMAVTLPSHLDPTHLRRMVGRVAGARSISRPILSAVTPLEAHRAGAARGAVRRLASSQRTISCCCLPAPEIEVWELPVPPVGPDDFCSFCDAAVRAPFSLRALCDGITPYSLSNLSRRERTGCNKSRETD